QVIFWHSSGLTFSIAHLNKCWYSARFASMHFPSRIIPQSRKSSTRQASTARERNVFKASSGKGAVVDRRKSQHRQDSTQDNSGQLFNTSRLSAAGDSLHFAL